jgi:hypothetical protein
MSDLDITKIPSIMRKNKWDNGARLMENWFTSDPGNSPLTGTPSTNIITMKWVKSFSRAKVVYGQLMREKIWINEAAKKEIIKLVRRKGLLTKKKMGIGLPKLPINISDKDYIQFRKVGGGWDMATGDMDDLRASLANFVFRIIIVGEVSPILNEKKFTTGKYQVRVDEIGIYIKDSYDFNDAPGKDQTLGNWDIDDSSVGRTFLNGGENIYNSDFREWRKKNNKGGDFFVYSDVEYIKLTTNNVFVFTE